ncbi:Transaldolase, partial [Termitomyces sp. T112]
MTLNALDILKESGLIIASDTGEYLKIGEFFPQDATTNPSLVFAAISKPQYAHLTDAAVQYALSRPGSLDLEAQTELACDYLLVQVGMQILNIIPGRVSVSIDPRLADDKDAIVAKGRTLISLFEELGYTRDRVLIKIPGTYSGILACKALETRAMSMLPDGSESISSPIHTNATLIFGLVQALACAQAGIS